MNTGLIKIFRFSKVCFWLAMSLLGLAACGSATSTPSVVYRPPTAQVQAGDAFSTALPPQFQPTFPAEAAQSSQSPPCTDSLSFLKDLTIPDGSQVPPGSTIDKRWLVLNSGTCNWDSSYRLKFISGDLIGAAREQGLYPARAGAQVPLRILFTAPDQAGTYNSSWQAAAPDGTPFGDAVFIEIVVTP